MVHFICFLWHLRLELSRQIEARSKRRQGIFSFQLSELEGRVWGSPVTSLRLIKKYLRQIYRKTL